MTFRTSILILMTAVCCSSQEEKKPYMLPKKTLDAVQRHYGILDALATAHVSGQAEIVNLATVDDWVSERYKLDRRKNVDKPLRSFSKEFGRVLREDEDKKTSYPIRLEFALRNSSEEAGQAAAMYLFNVSIRFEKGSFSGMPIGDWTGNWYDNSYGAHPKKCVRACGIRRTIRDVEAGSQDPSSVAGRIAASKVRGPGAGH